MNGPQKQEERIRNGKRAVILGYEPARQQNVEGEIGQGEKGLVCHGPEPPAPPSYPFALSLSRTDHSLSISKIDCGFPFFNVSGRTKTFIRFQEC